MSRGDEAGRLIPARGFMQLRQAFTSVQDGYRRVWAQALDITAVRLVVSTLRGLGDHDASHLAAGVAYFALLSLFPLLLGLLAIFGLWLPSQTIQQDLLDFARENIPGSVDLVEKNIDDVIRLRGPIGAIGLVGLFWSGSAVFGAVGRAVNRSWGIHKDRPFYVRKLRDLGMACGVGLLMLLSLGLTAVFSVLHNTDVWLPGALLEAVARIMGFAVSLAIFLVVYKFVPNTRVRWRYVWPGALLAAILFELSKTLFVLYVAVVVNYESVYGSVASTIALLVWIYIAAYVLILGAEFSFQYSRMRESGVSDGGRVTQLWENGRESQ